MGFEKKAAGFEKKAAGFGSRHGGLCDNGNRRNGKMHKEVQTPLGEVTISTPRDRNASYDPQFIKKRETILAEGVANRIIGLYAFGKSTREISDRMEENLGNRVSAETISSITDRVLPEIKAWKSRMLDPVYPIVRMDAIHYKVTDERGCAVTPTIYNVLGIDKEGHKNVLGMYVYIEREVKELTFG